MFKATHSAMLEPTALFSVSCWSILYPTFVTPVLLLKLGGAAECSGREAGEICLKTFFKTKKVLQNIAKATYLPYTR